MLKNLKLLDFIIVIFCFAISLFLIFYINDVKSSGQKMVKIKAQNNLYIYPLDTTDKILDFHGPSGLTQVQISGGEAKIVYSECRDKIGERMGAIKGVNQWVACLPNKVFVYIQGGDDEDNELDIVSF